MHNLRAERDSLPAAGMEGQGRAVDEQGTRATASLELHEKEEAGTTAGAGGAHSINAAAKAAITALRNERLAVEDQALLQEKLDANANKISGSAPRELIQCVMRLCDKYGLQAEASRLRLAARHASLRSINASAKAAIAALRNERLAVDDQALLQEKLDAHAHKISGSAPRELIQCVVWLCDKYDLEAEASRLRLAARRASRDCAASQPHQPQTHTGQRQDGWGGGNAASQSALSPDPHAACRRQREILDTPPGTPTQRQPLLRPSSPESPALFHIHDHVFDIYASTMPSSIRLWIDPWEEEDLLVGPEAPVEDKDSSAETDCPYYAPHGSPCSPDKQEEEEEEEEGL